MQDPLFVAAAEEVKFLQEQERGGELFLRGSAAHDMRAIALAVLERHAVNGVTGLPRGDRGLREAYMKQAISRAREEATSVSESRYFYVEYDLKNLKGVNTELGKKRANEEYIIPMAQLIKNTLWSLTRDIEGANFALFHPTGDEFSAFVWGVEERALTEALDEMARNAELFSAGYEMEYIVNPRDPFCFRNWGAGVHYGMVHISPFGSAADLFDRADKRVEHYRRGFGRLGTASFPERNRTELTARKRRKMFLVLLRYMWSRLRRA